MRVPPRPAADGIARGGSNVRPTPPRPGKICRPGFATDSGNGGNPRFFPWPGACLGGPGVASFSTEPGMSLVSDAVTTVAPTIVTADRAVNSVGANAVYERGTTFAQALSKVEPAPAVQDLLDQSGKLATPDAMTSLQT